MQHLIDPIDLSKEEIDDMLSLAQDIIKNKEKYSEVCKGKKLATLFYEPSTRTRLSFESAMLELGGSVLGFSEASSSSATKGESVEFTTTSLEGTVLKLADGSWSKTKTFDTYTDAITYLEGLLAKPTGD